MSGALAGLRVIELGTLIAGPFCARILGEFGAEVIKVEAPDGGDPLRTWRKVHDGTTLPAALAASKKKPASVPALTNRSPSGTSSDNSSSSRIPAIPSSF